MIDDNKIEELTTQYEDLKPLLSQARKHGSDTIMVELKMKNIPAKILMLKITMNETDFIKIRNRIESLKNHLELIEQDNETVINANEIFLESIDKIQDHVINKDIEAAKMVYNNMRAHYHKLPYEKKLKFYEKIINARWMIELNR